MSKQKNKIFIKNMVCNRCKLAVISILQQEKIDFIEVNLGEVLLYAPLSLEEIKNIKKKLLDFGFEWLEDKNHKQIQKIKTTIIHFLNENQTLKKQNLSNYLTERLHQDYGVLSRLFSEIVGKSIEFYTIEQKIEKIKEFLHYQEYNLNEIADFLGYSSAAHLSSQFKKITGFSPSFYKKNGKNTRKSIDQI